MPPDLPGDAIELSARARRDFAVVVPAYDEAENAADLIAELRTAFERHGLEGDVLVVDDGSKDGTAERMLGAAAGWDRLRVLKHRHNRGKTEALLTAAEATGARWIILFDADLQHSPDEIPRFLARLDEGWDIVTGRKVGAYQKRVVSGIYNRLSRAIFHIPVSDINSMKAFRRDILEEVQLRHDWHRFFIVLAFARGYSITEIDITLFPRRHGVAKYSGRTRIVTGLLDLLSVAFYLFFARKPLVLFGMTGIALAAFGFVVFFGAAIARAMGVGPPPIGYRPFLYLVILLLMLGFLLFGIGFVAEMVAAQQADIDALKRRLREPEDRV